MKKIFFLLLIGLSLNSFEQEKKMQFGIQLFPNFSTGIETEEIDKEFYIGIKTFVFSYSSGLRLDWNFAKKWTLSSGIMFSKNGDRSILIPKDPKRGFYFDHLYTTRFYYLELPLLVNYHLTNRLILEAGFNPLIYLFGNIKTTAGDYDYEILKKNQISSFGINSNFGLGYSFGESKQFKLFACSHFNLLTSNQALQLADYTPAKRNLAFGLKVVYLFN